MTREGGAALRANQALLHMLTGAEIRVNRVEYLLVCCYTLIVQSAAGKDDLSGVTLLAVLFSKCI